MSVCTVIQASTLHWMQLTAVQPVLTRYEPTGSLFHMFYLHRTLSCVLEWQFQVSHSSSCNMERTVRNAVARFTDFEIPHCLHAVQHTERFLSDFIALLIYTCYRIRVSISTCNTIFFHAYNNISVRWNNGEHLKLLPKQNPQSSV